jgi:hypothetical protein
MNRRIGFAIGSAGVLVITAGVSAQEATPEGEAALAGPEIVASGLTNPRGFAWGEDGTLYVALAGLPAEDVPAIEVVLGIFGGPSAAIARIQDGCPVTVADGLPSYIDGTGAVAGVSDVAILDGQLYATGDGRRGWHVRGRGRSLGLDAGQPGR